MNENIFHDLQHNYFMMDGMEESVFFDNREITFELCIVDRVLII